MMSLKCTLSRNCYGSPYTTLFSTGKAGCKVVRGNRAALGGHYELANSRRLMGLLPGAYTKQRGTEAVTSLTSLGREFVSPEALARGLTGTLAPRWRSYGSALGGPQTERGFPEHVVLATTRSNE